MICFILHQFLLPHFMCVIQIRSDSEVMKGCVGCIDGLLVEIRAPSNRETSQSGRFHSRKGFHALNIQAVSYVHGRFLAFEIRAPGSMSDIGMEVSATEAGLGSRQTAKRILDRGRRCLSKHRLLGRPIHWQSICRPGQFNWAHSQLRIWVQMTFGKYIGRWGILWRPLRMHFGRAGIIALCCAKLQNIIISYDLANNQYYKDEAKYAFKKTALDDINSCVAAIIDNSSEPHELSRQSGKLHCVRPRLLCPCDHHLRARLASLFVT